MCAACAPFPPTTPAASSQAVNAAKEAGEFDSRETKEARARAKEKAELKKNKAHSKLLLEKAKAKRDGQALDGADPLTGKVPSQDPKRASTSSPARPASAPAAAAKGLAGPSVSEARRLELKAQARERERGADGSCGAGMA